MIIKKDLLGNENLIDPLKPMISDETENQQQITPVVNINFKNKIKSGNESLRYRQGNAFDNNPIISDNQTLETIDDRGI